MKTTFLIGPHANAVGEVKAFRADVVEYLTHIRSNKMTLRLHNYVAEVRQLDEVIQWLEEIEVTRA